MYRHMSEKYRKWYGRQYHPLMVLVTYREGDRARAKREGREEELLFYVLLLLLLVWPLQRDVFMCYFYNYRNTRNEKLNKSLLKLM